MDSKHREQLSNAENSRWAAFPMLFLGTFGTKTPAERRFMIRSWLAALVAVCWVLFAFAVHFSPKPLIGSTTLFVAGAVITYFAWELRRYLYTLDELARRMQLEAMAWTYITGLVLAAWLGALVPFSHTLTHWPFIVVIPFLYFLLEPIRTGWLYYLSRRY